MPASLWNEYYKGAHRKRRYFEGWYFKQVSADLGEAWSFIPGISRGERKGEDYCFVQAIEGGSGRTWWFQYPAEDFRAAGDRLDIRVGRSSFSETGIALDLEGEAGSIRGELRFGPFKKLDTSLLRPGVMGPYAFAPFMECKHGLLSLSHRVEGSFEVLSGGESRSVRIVSGRGYLEKDWGSSMPSSWIWMQSNNFASEGDSFMLSIARIPWLGSAFTGFLCVGSLGGRSLLEASYTGARLSLLGLEDGRLSLALLGRHTRLEVSARRSRGGLLRAPVRGSLTRRISESLDAFVALRWLEDGRVIFEGEAPGAGLELVGDPPSLFASRSP
jgi:hypothetical protein